MAFCAARRSGVGCRFYSLIIRKQLDAAIGNTLSGSSRSFISSLQVHHIGAWNRSSSYQSAAAALVAASGVAAMSDTTDSVALMEGSNNDDSLISMHEPGSVEEIQHAVVECFGSSPHGNIMNNAERLMTMVQQAFTQALTEYVNPMSSFENDKDSDKIIDNKFPSLEVSLLNQNCGNGRFEFNSPEPLPIENDFFSGQIQINLNSHIANDKGSLSDANDMFEIQLQGRFKRIPKGVVYCGGELADESFRFGPLMKGLANGLLKLLVRFIGNNLEYSFGSTKATEGSRLPFISFPLKTAMNDIVVTPPEEVPPRMGEGFFESTESRTLRKGSSSDAKDWSLENTYSMSFTASSIDLTTWKVLYPFETSLSLFWGNSPLRLVIYEKGEQHDNTNNYLLALQVKFVGMQKDLEGSTVKSENADQTQGAPLNAV